MGGQGSKPLPELGRFSEEEQEWLSQHKASSMSPQGLTNITMLPLPFSLALVQLFAADKTNLAFSELVQMLSILCHAKIAEQSRVRKIIYDALCISGQPEGAPIQAGEELCLTDTTLGRAVKAITHAFIDSQPQVASGDTFPFLSAFLSEALDQAAAKKYPNFTIADHVPQHGPHLTLDNFSAWVDRIAGCLLSFLQHRLRLCFSSPVPYLPTLETHGVNHMLTSPQMWVLREHMELSSRKHWELLFHSSVHGQSLNQLITNCRLQGPLLVLVRDTTNGIFGGYMSESLDKKPDFYGSASSFVFALEPFLSIFPASGMNGNYTYCNMHTQTLENGVGMGGQTRHHAWWIDEGCHTGHSEPTVTFKSPRLSTEHRFTIDAIEVWGCDLTQAVTVDENSREALKSEDKFLFDLVGRTGHADCVAVDLERDSDND